MDISLFTSFEGRIPRSHFWAGIVILFLIEWIVWIIIATTFGMRMMPVDTSDPALMMRMLSGFGIPALIFALIFLYPALAIYAKRWHDRDKSGWWTLILIIPFIGPIWFFVECGCLRGTEGSNRYGPDPLSM